MRYLLLSDVHGNAVALEAVLRHAKTKRWDKVIFLGDAVGYYSQPNEVVQLIRELNPIISIIGNHEDLLIKFMAEPHHMALKEDSIVSEVIQIHAGQITPDNMVFIRELKDRVICDTWEVTHGGLRAQWEYLSTLQNAQSNAAFMQRDLCFIGHTHVPIIYASVETPKGEMWRTLPFKNTQMTYRLPPKAKIFFNPGSVGQPRDGIALASYAIFDEDLRSIDHFRVEFDIFQVQRLLREQNYPEVLGKRLVVGK
ncbi:MAG: metallophosphoesterase family protein [Trueperaceae bacterium]|nr:metallophosphoesterase family protein [Trueperaceae bacterium]